MASVMTNLSKNQEKVNKFLKRCKFKIILCPAIMKFKAFEEEK